jgi:hypothetical protein
MAQERSKGERMQDGMGTDIWSLNFLTFRENSKIIIARERPEVYEMKHMKLKAQGDLRIHFRLPSAMKG